MAQLQAIRNHIIFQFVDASTKKQESIGKGDQGHHEFIESTDWGFEFSHRDETANNPRWVIITSVGHEAADDFQPGMKVLVEHLMWTNGFDFQDEKYWRTDATHVLAVDDSVAAA